MASNSKYTKTLKEMRVLTNKRVKDLGGPLSPMKGPLSKSTDPYPVSAAKVANQPGTDGFASLIAPGNRIRNWSGDSKYWSKKDGVLVGKTDGTLKRTDS